MMTDHKLQAIGQRYGIKLSDRSASGNYLWNGETLARSYQKWADDCLCSTSCIEVARSLPYEPYKLSRPVLCSRMHRIPDYETLHDIGHHIVAESWARDLPEWGLGCVPGEYAANGGYHLLTGDYPEESLHHIFDGLFPQEEQNRQEALANLIGYVLMREHDVMPPEAWRKTWVPTYLEGGTRHWALMQLSSFGFSVDDGKRALVYMEAG